MANYHLRLAIKLSPAYPVAYYTYAYLLNEINDHRCMQLHAAKALSVRGIDATIIYIELAKSYERNGNYPEAISAYLAAMRYSLCDNEISDIDKSLERVRSKRLLFENNRFKYSVV